MFKILAINSSQNVQGLLPVGVVVTASQLDLPFLTPLPVVSCGRLQLGVAHLLLQ